MMVGRDVLLRVAKRPADRRRALLEVEHLEVSDDRRLPAVRDVSFQVAAGEIVGLAGVDANGQRELIEAISGLRGARGGRVVVAGRDVTHATVRERLEAGLAHIHEDRHRARPRAAVLARREHGASRLPAPAELPPRHPRPRAIVRRAALLLREFDVRGGTTSTRAERALGWQPAEGRARA